MSNDDLTLLISAPEPLVEPAAAEAPPTVRARVRWAGIVWGVAFAALAWAGMWLTGEPDRVNELATWLQGINTMTAVAYGLLAVGALALVTGLVGLLRRAQHALATS